MTDGKNEELKNLKRLRRMFHQNPEIAWTEFWTSDQICGILEDFGYEILYGEDLYGPELASMIKSKIKNTEMIEECFRRAVSSLGETERIRRMKGGLTGAIAHMRCKAGGPKIAFRFDIDALPIKESEDVDHSPYKKGFASRNSNMHACAHDGHIAIGLGLAKRISENRSSIIGDYYLIFQPAEEAGSGGYYLSKLDLIKELAFLVPVHIGIIDERKIVCGLSFLSRREFEVIFHGTSSHASAYPNKGRNALAAACMAATSLYGIERHGDGFSSIGIGEFLSNNLANVISDLAKFNFELRGESEEICNHLENRSMDIIAGACRMYGVESEINPELPCIAVRNSDLLKEYLKESALKAGHPNDRIMIEKLAMGSEDATYLMRSVQEGGGKASYVCLGSPTYGGHHNPKFDFDEDVLIDGVDLLWNLIEHISSSHGKL